MKNKLFNCLLATSIFIFSVKQVSAQRNWLTSSATREQLTSYLESLDSWREVKKQSLQQAINQLPDETKLSLIKSSEGYLSYEWPNLPATVFLQFSENGNRTNYQEMRGQRRKALSELGESL